MPQLVTFRLDRLRCLAERDSRGGSEPYLWVTYFVLDGRNIAQPEPVTVHTPVFDAFRTEFPDNVRAGQVIRVPPFLANFSAQVDPGPLNLMMAGCVVVLLEEDDTPDRAIRSGRNAYAAGIQRQLNALIRERIRTADRQPVTEGEVKAIRDALEPAVKSAIRSNLSLGQKIFGDQDDVLAFGHVAFTDDEIESRNFVFPLLTDESLRNRFVLSGTLSVAPVPPEPVDPCAELRQGVQSKSDEVKALQAMLAGLQQRLQTATPQAKPAIVQQITETGLKISQAEAELQQRESVLRFCETGVIQAVAPAEPAVAMGD